MLSRRFENKNEKSKQFAVALLILGRPFDDFWKSESRVFVILEVQGLILRILLIFVFPGTIKEPPGRRKESQS